MTVIFVGEKRNTNKPETNIDPEVSAVLRRLKEVYVHGHLVAPNTDNTEAIARKQKEIEDLRNGKIITESKHSRR